MNENKPCREVSTSRFGKSELLLGLVFLLSLPLLNPWVRGDGVGYYALVRAPLIQRNLDFTEDYRHANESFRDARVDQYGRPRSEYRTRTGHLENHFAVGSAILWAPFLLPTHAGVLLARALGSSIPADGFSAPYRIAMAFATGLYGFLGLLFAFRLARLYVDKRWALLATFFHLVGQFAPRLHVFQSLVVARPFRVCRGTFPLVLARNAG